MRPLRLVLVAAAAAVGACAGPSPAADTAQRCTADVNAPLARLVHDGTTRPIDGVVVCGVTISASRTQSGGPHGDHQILVVRAPFPDGSRPLVEVVTNDALDGPVTAPAGAAVAAYGQYFAPRRRYAAGLHDVHCATHRGAVNGWVSVDGRRYPQSCR